MNHSVIVAISSDGETTTIRILKHSRGCGYVVFNQLCQDFYGFSYDPVGCEGLVKICWRNPRVPLHRRALLLMSFDVAYVRKPHYSRAARDIRAWLDDYPARKGLVNHWPEILEFYESAPDHYAIGVHQSSLSENPFKGRWIKEERRYAPIDLQKDFFEVYDELDACESRNGAGRLDSTG